MSRLFGAASRITLAAALCLAPLYAAGQAEEQSDPVYGAWVLNLEKSSFYPGPAPQSQHRYYEPDEDGVRASVVTVNARGGESTTEYVAAYDGVEYPFRGAQNVDAIIMERLDRNTALATFKHGRRISGVAHRIISPDGNSMTVTLQIGDSVRNVAVYDRTDPGWRRNNPFLASVATNVGIILGLMLVVVGVGYVYTRAKGGSKS